MNMSKRSYKIEILEKISQLTTAGFGLVAALAWNDAIQALFKKIFGDASALTAKFAYAALITVLVVLITLKIGDMVDKVKGGQEGK